MYQISKQKISCEVFSVANQLFEGDEAFHHAKLVGTRDRLPIYRYSLDRLVKYLPSFEGILALETLHLKFKRSFEMI
jgi:hypothetical protein